MASNSSEGNPGLSPADTTANIAPPPSSIASSPWVQLVAGVICMAMIANLQYGWTIFINPIDAKYHWGKVAIQFAFTLFVLFETWLVPFEAYLADRFAPRPLVMAGAFLFYISPILISRGRHLSFLKTAGIYSGT